MFLSLLHQLVPLHRLKHLLSCPNCPYIKWLGWVPLSAEGLADVADFKTQQTNPSAAMLSVIILCVWNLSRVDAQREGERRGLMMMMQAAAAARRRPRLPHRACRHVR